MHYGNKEATRLYKICIQENESSAYQESPKNEHEEQKSKNTCLAHTTLWLWGVDGEQVDGADTGGDGDVVLE